MTITIQIGNSDDKLSQIEWSDFTNELYDLINSRHGYTVHFFGHSLPDQQWQNCAIVFSANFDDDLEKSLKYLVKKYHQDSIAVTIGTTSFIK